MKKQKKKRLYEPGDPDKLDAFLKKHKRKGSKKAGLNKAQKPTKEQVKEWLKKKD